MGGGGILWGPHLAILLGILAIFLFGILQVKVLYVRNLKSDITEEQLQEKFEPYGKIERVKKIKDYGFVHFCERSSAVKAMEELNGTVILWLIELHISLIFLLMSFNYYWVIIFVLAVCWRFMFSNLGPDLKLELQQIFFIYAHWVYYDMALPVCLSKDAHYCEITQ